MKISINRKALLDALNQCKSVAEKSTALPALSCVLISTNADGTVHLSASNLMCEIRITVRAEKIDVYGQCLVNVFNLVDRLAVFPDGTLQLTEKDGRSLQIKCGTRKHTLHALPACEAVPSHEPPEGCGCAFQNETLKKLIHSVRDCISTDSSREPFHFIYIEFQSKYARSVASNGHALAVCTIGSPNILGENVLLSRASLPAICGMLDRYQETIKVAINSAHLWFLTESTALGCRLPAATTSPLHKYEQLFPKDNDGTMIVDRKALIDSLRSALAASKTKEGRALMTTNDGRLGIHGESPEAGESEDEIDVEYTGKPVKMGVNSEYMINALKVLTSERIRISFGGELDPLLLRELETENMQRIVMPCRL